MPNLFLFPRVSIPPHICNRTPSFGFNIEPKAKPAPPKKYAKKISK